ncbi:hypothetical protein EGR_09467 [Echinococcus granulosus]|uniref:Uncharacterized protein n=1 Tax=Echinococcus granulosus TaxID=6210 RepID=W6UQG2_ECHGR|nr:hypothetical protein EGR_09467 [Echinococcus granulosus]EUB55659.1 hypothetical protein EGR_09467 [Echinococcus granulosus]
MVYQGMPQFSTLPRHTHLRINCGNRNFTLSNDETGGQATAQLSVFLKGFNSHPKWWKFNKPFPCLSVSLRLVGQLNEDEEYVEIRHKSGEFNFCADSSEMLKRGMFYGIEDIAKDMIGYPETVNYPIQTSKVFTTPPTNDPACFVYACGVLQAKLIT